MFHQVVLVVVMAIQTDLIINTMNLYILQSMIALPVVALFVVVEITFLP